jgi:hypothetical protein
MSYKLSDDERDEFRERKPKYIRCSDSMCGAEDCPTCHPEILTPQPAKKAPLCTHGIPMDESCDECNAWLHDHLNAPKGNPRRA